MSDNEQQLEAINRFLETLKAEDGLMTKFRDAFPGFAEGLLDCTEELSDDELEAVAAGLGLAAHDGYHCGSLSYKADMDPANPTQTAPVQRFGKG